MSGRYPVAAPDEEVLRKLAQQYPELLLAPCPLESFGQSADEFLAAWSKLPLRCPFCAGTGWRLSTLEELLEDIEERGARGVLFAGHNGHYLVQNRSLANVFGQREFEGCTRREAAARLLIELERYRQAVELERIRRRG